MSGKLYTKLIFKLFYFILFSSEGYDLKYLHYPPPLKFKTFAFSPKIFLWKFWIEVKFQKTDIFLETEWKQNNGFENIGIWTFIHGSSNLLVEFFPFKTPNIQNNNIGFQNFIFAIKKLLNKCWKNVTINKCMKCLTIY